jgi:hypothetical protein
MITRGKLILDTTTEKTCFYYVDESGDAVVFGKGKKLQVGIDNCPRFFFLGLLEVEDPDILTAELEHLRGSILSNPDLLKLPGVDEKYRKTYEKFHAVDDHPIVRRIVYDFISKRKDLRFICVLKDKLITQPIFCKFESEISTVL